MIKKTTDHSDHFVSCAHKLLTAQTMQVTFDMVGFKVGVGELFCKRPGSKYYRLCGYTVSVPATELCLCRLKAAIDEKKKNTGVAFSNKILFTETDTG